MTGATAAIAQFPQIELPQAIRMAHALRQAEQAAYAIACRNGDRDDADDADDQDRAERHDCCGTDGSAEHHDRAFEHKFRADMDAEIEAWTWPPRRADRYPDQDREHQRFKVGVPDKIGFCRFQKHRRQRDGDAEKNAWQKALQVIQQWMPRYRRFLESCSLYRE